ncbi:MAG TPA: hypothetical protein PK886_01520 [Candidatus Paceibacterota bacterium]|nr:hypothetical protein [Candidatus Paceibacterota bacterium]
MDEMLNDRNKEKYNTKIEKISDTIERLDVVKPRPRAKMVSQDFSYIKKQWESKIEKTKEYMPTLPKSIFKKFFTAALVFFLFSGLLFAYKFFVKGTSTFSSDMIDLEVVGSSFSPGGQDLPLSINITNRNPVDLEATTLFIEYPKGSDELGDKVRVEESLGELKSGKSISKEISIVLFGEQNSIKNINIRLEYRTKDSNAIFKKEKNIEVVISEVPVTLSFVVPEKSASNQEVTLKVKAVLNSEKAPEDLALLMNYPIGFEFTEATPKPSSGNNIFDLSNIKQGEEKSILITGRLLGEAGEERSFHASIGEQDMKDSSKLAYSFNSTSKVITIDSSVIAVNLSLNGSNDDKYTASAGENVIGVVSWSNNTDKTLRDLEIKVNLGGSVYADSNVTTATGGFFDSASDSILWDKNSVPKFSSVSPGDSGTVSFSVKAGNFISSTSNPNIDINISVKAKDPSLGNSIIEINNQESAEVVYSSNLQFAAKARYRSGPIQNSGPLPPRAEQPTTYTITWTITNTSNQAKNGVLVTRIPPYITYVGNAVPQSEALSYNASTREITWSVGDISAQAGSTAPNREVSFQIELRPSISQIGTQPIIVYDSTLKAVDRFTGANLSSVRSELTTNLVNDPGFQGNEAAVTQ